MFESAPSLMISQVIFPQFNKESSAGKQKTAGVLSFPQVTQCVARGSCLIWCQCQLFQFKKKGETGKGKSTDNRRKCTSQRVLAPDSQGERRPWGHIHCRLCPGFPEVRSFPLWLQQFPSSLTVWGLVALTRATLVEAICCGGAFLSIVPFDGFFVSVYNTCTIWRFPG